MYMHKYVNVCDYMFKYVNVLVCMLACLCNDFECVFVEWVVHHYSSNN